MAKKKVIKPKPCHIIDTMCDAKFTREVTKYIEEGYVVSSSFCTVINDETYQYCSSYQAIMVKREHHV